MLPFLATGAANARFAPVYVDDVAQCFVRSLALDRTIGKRYPLCGPKTYTLRELVRYAGAVAQSPRPVVALSPRFARAQAFLLEHAPGQLMSRDNLLSMQQDCVCGGAFPPEFSIPPTTIESVAPSYLAPEAAISHCEAFRVRRARSAR
jgi:NADH dehydrogenase